MFILFWSVFLECINNVDAIMERINGILKDEFLMNETYMDIKSITRAVKEVIKTYNEERPHLSLSYKTPFFVYHNGTVNQAD